MRVLIASGGTGGHLFPAISLAEELKGRNPDSRIWFVTSEKEIDTKVISKRGFEFSILKVDGITFRLNYKNLLSIARLIRAFFDSLLLILRFKPEVVIGFGGYVSFPVVLAGLFLKKKTIIHEQNVKPGRANRFLAYFVDSVAISFEKTGEFLRKKNVSLTGNPLRQEFLNMDRQGAVSRLSVLSDKFRILVIGGSQGAHRLNMLIPEALSMLNGPLRYKLQLMHITGNKDFNLVSESYNRLSIDSKVFSFLDEIGLAYLASDLVIARSGATTICEILFFKLPSILIPYPYAMAHQSLNARILEEAGCCILREETDLSKGELKNLLLELYNNRALLKQMSENCNKLFVKDSAKKLADLVEAK